MLPLNDAGGSWGVLDDAGDVDGAAHVHEHLGLAQDRSHRDWKNKNGKSDKFFARKIEQPHFFCSASAGTKRPKLNQMSGLGLHNRASPDLDSARDFIVSGLSLQVRNRRWNQICRICRSLYFIFFHSQGLSKFGLQRRGSRTKSLDFEKSWQSRPSAQQGICLSCWIFPHKGP